MSKWKLLAACVAFVWSSTSFALADIEESIIACKAQAASMGSLIKGLFPHAVIGDYKVNLDASRCFLSFTTEKPGEGFAAWMVDAKTAELLTEYHGPKHRGICKSHTSMGFASPRCSYEEYLHRLETIQFVSGL